MKLTSYSFYNGDMSHEPRLEVLVEEIPEERVADFVRHLKAFWGEKTVWEVKAVTPATAPTLPAPPAEEGPVEVAVTAADKVIAENARLQEAAAEPKKRGRPAGSPNKPKPAPTPEPVKLTDPALLVSNDGMGDPDSDEEVFDEEEEEEAPPAKKSAKPQFNIGMMQGMTKLRDILFYLRDTCGVKDAAQLVAICTEAKQQVPVLSRIQDIKGRVESTLEVFSE